MPDPHPPVRKREGRLSSDTVAALNADLAARFGNCFTASEAVRKAHGHTLTWLENQPPDAVVFAETREDVIDVVKLCARHDAPIVPFGVGSSLEGHVNAPHGGVSLDCSRMNARPRRQRRGPRLRRRARRHPQAAQRPSARHGALLPHRSRRRRVDRRHGGDPRLGHQRRALRHDEGSRAVARRRHRRRHRSCAPARGPRNPRPATT